MRDVHLWRVFATTCGWANLGIALFAAQAGWPTAFFMAGIGAVLCFGGRTAL